MIRLPQPRAQYLLTAENIKRQVAVFVVVAVEEPSFLFTVQRQVGCIDVENKLRRRLLMRFDEQLRQQFIHSFFPVRDLLVTVGTPAPSSMRFNVLLPASQRSICSRSASTWNSGSVRSCS